MGSLIVSKLIEVKFPTWPNYLMPIGGIDLVDGKFSVDIGSISDEQITVLCEDFRMHCEGRRKK